MLFGSKLPEYAAMKMNRLPVVHSVFVSIVTHCVEPVVFVNV
jgi:hypothetical protein